MAVSIPIAQQALPVIDYLAAPTSQFRVVNQDKVEGVKRLYHADNIDVLSALIHDKEVCGKINLIYIDPPYNTGGAFETREFVDRKSVV